MAEFTPTPGLSPLFDVAKAAAVAATTPYADANHVVTRVVPATYKVDHHAVEQYLATPGRKRGVVRLLTTDALVADVARHETTATVAYVVPGSTSVHVIYNDHDELRAGWRDHGAHLAFKTTPAWQRWAAADRKMMDQTAFAELIEDGMTEVLKPAGADLLELAQSIHASTSAAFKSAVRLRDGQTQVSYVEEISATAGKDGNLTIPSTIELLVAPFYGADPVVVTARLRIRVAGGKLTLGIILNQPEQVVEQALAAEVGKLLTAHPDLPIMWAHAAPGIVEPLT